MSKPNILEKRAAHSAQSIQPQDLPSASATAQMQQAIEQEKARRQSRSQPLDVLEYQPCEQDSALHLLQGWHLLFFARTGTALIPDLRAALQHGGAVPCADPRDVQLMKYFKRVQAQYRQHTAQSSQSVSESVASQPVIAEIRYGGLSIASGFWLPADMEIGLSLIPTTGARLALGDLTLVQHGQPGTSQSLDVLLVTAPHSRTKAELAAQRSLLGDRLELALERHTFTFSTPLLAFLGIFAVGATYAVTEVAIPAAAAATAVPAAALVATATVGGAPPKPPAEDIVNLRAERVRSLGAAPSSSQLIEMRQQLLAAD